MMCARRGVSPGLVSRPYPPRESCQIPQCCGGTHLGTPQRVTARPGNGYAVRWCGVGGLKHPKTPAVRPTPADPLGGFQRAFRGRPSPVGWAI
jgi:hypothetical protein